MSTSPLVSVIIPTCNYGKFIAATLDSVRAQSYHPLETIVVDDGSTDHTADVVRAYPEVRYFYQSNQGVSVARNRAIAEAQGEFIAFLDADDVWQPNKLSIQIAYMLENPDVGITATKIKNFIEPGTQLPSWFQPEIGLEDHKSPIPSTLAVRRTVFSQIGNFSPDYRASEDLEWLCRARDAQIPIITLPETLILRRLHGANLSWQAWRESVHRAIKILRASLARKTQRLVD